MLAGVLFCFLLFEASFLNISCRFGVGSCLDEYRNLRFWDEEIGWCFVGQETFNSCGPASVQIVLWYLNVKPLPSQSELAVEMHSDMYHYIEAKYMALPFEKRNFTEYVSGVLSDNFSEALFLLKSLVCQNFPAIILTWYDVSCRIGHYRVVTGYNESGIFVHDPYDGPNIFFNNSILERLWRYSGYWALVIFSQPYFNLTVNVCDLLGSPLDNVSISILGEVTGASLTNENGIVVFERLPLGYYAIEIRFDSNVKRDDVIIVKNIFKSYRYFIITKQSLIRLIIIIIIITTIILFFFVILRTLILSLY